MNRRAASTSAERDVLLAQLEAEEAAGWPDLPDPTRTLDEEAQRRALTELLAVIATAIGRPIQDRSAAA